MCDECIINSKDLFGVRVFTDGSVVDEQSTTISRPTHGSYGKNIYNMKRNFDGNDSDSDSNDSTEVEEEDDDDDDNNNDENCNADDCNGINNGDGDCKSNGNNDGNDEDDDDSTYDPNADNDEDDYKDDSDYDYGDHNKCENDDLACKSTSDRDYTKCDNGAVKDLQQNKYVEYMNISANVKSNEDEYVPIKVAVGLSNVQFSAGDGAFDDSTKQENLHFTSILIEVRVLIEQPELNKQIDAKQLPNRMTRQIASAVDYHEIDETCRNFTLQLKLDDSHWNGKMELKSRQQHFYSKMPHYFTYGQSKPRSDLVYVGAIVDEHLVKFTRAKWNDAYETFVATLPKEKCRQFKLDAVNCLDFDETTLYITLDYIDAQMKCVADQFISFALKSQLQYAQKMKRHNTKALKYSANFSRYEIEIFVFEYFKLYSKDLFEYKETIQRGKEKSILKYLLSTQLNGANLKSCHLKILNNITNQAFDYGIDSKFLPKSAVHLIKRHFTTLYNASDEKHRKLWTILLKMLNVHHYLCPHTFDQVVDNSKIFFDIFQVQSK